MGTHNKRFSEKLAGDVCNYIDYLARSRGFSISLHLVEGAFVDSWPMLLKYNYHRCPVCREIRASTAAYAHCVDRQPKVLQRAAQSPFMGVCYAGVAEFVFPLFDVSETVRGFLCVSGFTFDRANSIERACAAAAKYGLSPAKLVSAASRLNPSPPDFAGVSSQILPIQDMVATLFHFISLDSQPGDTASAREGIYRQLVQYANGNFRNPDLTLGLACRALSVSYSYASHVFAQFNDLPFNRYIRRMRIEAAKSYLEHTDYPVSIVAFEVGFLDSNYFSTVFRSETGMSPSEYRHKRRGPDRLELR